ncbi:MAG: hypothetical protein M1834_007946 [Cirrosporium novae-zelandiae]|nr:MAG: hypothetical protein M1834_007946 [Cirrosporium novae-zelandiae]
MALSVSTSMCSAQSIPYPTVFGAEFSSLQASLVSNYSGYVHEGYYINHASINVENVSFCNVTLAYTHPGQNDTVNVMVWLPVDEWNERMQGIGGGGWVAGNYFSSWMAMTGAVGEGYMAVTTNGGHTTDDPFDWALVSPGNVNLYLLQDFASVSLNDAAIIGKKIARSFYGQPPKYSYWSGCSQGGRQGMMLAQRYPTAYDGIAASAPGINWSEVLVGDYWAQLIMTLLGEYPRSCELTALTDAAVLACDGNDGLTDGLISDPESCYFDPYTLVGTTINCTGTGLEMQISTAAAAVANATWTGAQSSNGTQLWYGMGYDTTLTADTAVANTECSTNGTCIGQPFNISSNWIRLFVEKNPKFDFSNMTHQDFDHIFHTSVQQFASIIGTADPDLSEFRDAGGKMLTYHGLADGIIPTGGSSHYYESVKALDPDVHSYYRLFESPGLAHCYGGSGPYPYSLFNNLVKWVESGIAPENLTASFTASNGVQNHRILCPYPQRAHYNGGNSTSVDGFYCST